MLDIMPLWGWILVLIILVALVGALLLLNDKINKQVRRFGIHAIQELNDVLEHWAKTDEQLRELATDSLQALRAEAQSLIDKGEELVAQNKNRALQLRDRVDQILSERGL